MKNKLKLVIELFSFIGVAFILICLQTWYILTGNE